MYKLPSQYHPSNPLCKIRRNRMDKLWFKVVTRDRILLLVNSNDNNKITPNKNKENIKRNNKRKREEIRTGKTMLTPEPNYRFNISLYRSHFHIIWDKCLSVRLKWCLLEPIKWCHRLWHLSKSILRRACSLQRSRQCSLARTFCKVNNNNRQQCPWLVSKCFNKRRFRCLRWSRVATIQVRFHTDNHKH